MTHERCAWQWSGVRISQLELSRSLTGLGHEYAVVPEEFPSHFHGVFQAVDEGCQEMIV